MMIHLISCLLLLLCVPPGISRHSTLPWWWSVHLVQLGLGSGEEAIRHQGMHRQRHVCPGLWIVLYFPAVINRATQLVPGLHRNVNTKWHILRPSARCSSGSLPSVDGDSDQNSAFGIVPDSMIPPEPDELGHCRIVLAGLPGLAALAGVLGADMYWSLCSCVSLCRQTMMANRRVLRLRRQGRRRWEKPNASGPHVVLVGVRSAFSESRVLDFSETV
jgi:hypothetical protein